jgi:hypothetical protein
MPEPRERIHEMVSALKQQRDELSLRIHLAKAEAKQEWDRPEDKLNQLSHRFDPHKNAVGETADDVWQSLKLLGEEIQHRFERIRKSP